MDAKLKNAAPYNLFFNVLDNCPKTSKDTNSIKFKDLLCPTLGNLKQMLLITKWVDFEWLSKEVPENIPITLIYQKQRNIEKKSGNITPKKIEDSRSHHTKIMILAYDDDSIRVIVPSADLQGENWNKYNQSIWISPICPKLKTGDSDGVGPTKFKTDLIQYLKVYKFASPAEWIELIEHADFSDVKVFFIYQLPDCKKIPVTDVGDLLSKHCKLPEVGNQSDWKIIAQTHVIGDQYRNNWLLESFLPNLSKHITDQNGVTSEDLLKIIYPSVKNVNESVILNDDVLRYYFKIHQRQPNLTKYMCQWKADQLGRTEAVPQISSCCRTDRKRLAYYILNPGFSLSRWGQHDRTQSYNAFLLFLPTFFDEDYFELDGNNKNTIRLMYDMPLKPYRPDDKPYLRYK